jgi:hypothetical protein
MDLSQKRLILELEKKLYTNKKFCEEPIAYFPLIRQKTEYTGTHTHTHTHTAR